MSDSDGLAEDAAARIRAACRRAGLEVARIEPLAAGLSLRRFARVELRGAAAPSLVARLEAPEDPAGRPSGAAPEPPLEPIRALLEARGLPVPRRLGGDPDGLDLLEDVDRLDLRGAIARADPAERAALYTEACQWAARLQRIGPVSGVAAFQRRLDPGLIAYKAGLLASDGIGARGRRASPAESDCVRKAFAHIAAELEQAPRRLAHRDYQSSNLYVDPAAAPGQRLRMIDLQGAFLAPPEYDAVCLLCDSYVELAGSEIEAHGEALRRELPDPVEPDEFVRRFDWLTLTRKGKDYARFVHAARRGDRRFLEFLPTTLSHLRRAARRAAARDAWLQPLAELLAGLPEAPCVG